jgi:hypothetical protein
MGDLVEGREEGGKGEEKGGREKRREGGREGWKERTLILQSKCRNNMSIS